MMFDWDDFSPTVLASIAPNLVEGCAPCLVVSWAITTLT
jgi:hypothetical protein